MSFKDIMLISEISQSQLPLHAISKIVKSMEAENRMLVARVFREGNGKLLFNRYKVSVVQTKLSSGDQLCSAVSIVNDAVM